MASPVKEYQSFEHFMSEVGQPQPAAPKSYTHKIAQTIQSEIAPHIATYAFDIGSYWSALPALGFGLGCFSQDSWMVYALTGIAAQICDTKVDKEQIATVTKVATGIFGLHTVMGAYNIALANTSPTYENILGIVFDALYIIKTASIITNLAKNE